MCVCVSHIRKSERKSLICVSTIISQENLSKIYQYLSTVFPTSSLGVISSETPEAQVRHSKFLGPGPDH